jgi:FecR protein
MPMPQRTPYAVRARFVAVLLSSVAPFGGAVAQSGGSVSAANPRTTGTPPGGSLRSLQIGSNVVYRERVQTSETGTAQITFPDRTTLNVGRNSNLLIDEFVYNPDAGSGRMALSLAKGALRFVGGQVSHTEGASVKTPPATLGVRGGVATVLYKADTLPPDPLNCGGATFINHFGVLIARNNVSARTIGRSGYGVCVSSPNQPIPEPVPVSDAFLARVVALLRSGPGQHGGATVLPTDDLAARNGLTLPRLGDPNTPPGVNALDRSGVFSTGDDFVRNQAQTRQLNQIQLPPPPPPPPPPYR